MIYFYSGIIVRGVRMIKLGDLVKVLGIERDEKNFDIDISGIAYDSRKVQKGCLFVAITGFKEDGHRFIESAINNGASAIIVEKDVKVASIPVIKVDDSRKALAKLSAKFYNYPSKDLTVIGVTGTNGKTTTTYLIDSILKKLGINTGLIGTIKNKIGDKEENASRTTPESLDLQRIFSEMLESEVTHVVMEVSSHALELDRVLEVDFDRQVFTNLSQDHLDFHQSFEDYLKAKTKLFQLNENPSIINIDDKRSEYIIQESLGEVLSYGLNNKADIMAENIQVTQKGVSYKLKLGDKSIDTKLNLTGRFNVYNSLAAIGTVYSLGYGLKEIAAGLEEIEGVPGRFQIIDEGQQFGVIVDYAHTPDGMENVLNTAAEFTKGRKIVVFGCGGDRDRKKRPIMGRIGVTLGDFAIVTSDNPRSEKPMEIINEIEVGIKNEGKEEGKDYIIIEDRATAIKKAIDLANPEDIVIIVGKGHETYQILKDKTIDFDDREVARDAIRARGES